MLIAVGIGKSYGQEILSNVGFELRAGEIICLLGASGCGKTTLLKILAGLEASDQGEIGSSIARPGPRLGYLSQNDHLLPWRSALDNVALGLECLGFPKNIAQAKAASQLQLIGLESFMHHKASELSGGMRQRVLLARCLATEPELLLLDEPMSNLDILAREDLSAVIKNYVRQSGAAALIVTHSVEEACFLADRILFLSRAPGRIAAELNGDNINLNGAQEKLKSVLRVGA